MPIVPVNNVGQYGVVTDAPAHELPPNIWSEALNVHFREGRVERMMGHEAVFGTPTVDPYFLLPWYDPTSGARNWFYGNGTEVYKYNTSHVEVTAVAGDYAGGAHPNWQGSVLGGVPILNNDAGTDIPQMWDSGTTKFKDLTNWPASTWCKNIKAFKQFLVALYITEGGNQYPTKIIWSTPADPGAVPTSWVPSATNEAGSYPLSETPGACIDQLAMGDVNIIYKTDSIWMMRHTGGIFVFESRGLFRKVGALTYKCVLDFFKKHFVVTAGDVIVHNGQSIESVIDARTRRELFSLLDDDNYQYVFVTEDYRKNEIYICVPTVGSSELATRAFIWNWKDNTWSQKELVNIACSGLGQVIVNAENLSFDSDTGTFDAAEGLFNDGVSAYSELQTLLGEVGTGKAIHLQNQTYQHNGTDFDSYVIRENLAIAGKDRNGQIIINPDLVKFWRAIYPKVTGAPVQIRTGYRDTIDGDVTWNSYQTFDPSVDRKLDILMSGKLLNLEVRSSSGAPWKMSGYDLDLEIIGRF
jgi:hypothetical protein